MAILHMEVETVQETGRSLLRAATDMQDTATTLQYSIASLDSSWQSEASTFYMAEAKHLLRSIHQHIGQLDDLSRRVMSEAQQWLEADETKSGLSQFFDGFSFSRKDAAYLYAGGYLATHLRWSSLRPNSLIFTGPNWMRKTLDIEPMTRVIKPSTLLKKLAPVAYLQNVAEGARTGFETFNDPAFQGTDRALPAATLDGLVKTAMLAGGTTVLVATTALIVAAPLAPVIAGGAVIATWVAGDFVLDKFIQPRLWDTWQNSYQRDQAIEGVTRFTNDVNAFIESTTRESVRKVDNAFRRFIRTLAPAGS